MRLELEDLATATGLSKVLTFVVHTYEMQGWAVTECTKIAARLGFSAEISAKPGVHSKEAWDANKSLWDQRIVITKCIQNDNVVAYRLRGPGTQLIRNIIIKMIGDKYNTVADCLRGMPARLRNNASTRVQKKDRHVRPLRHDHQPRYDGIDEPPRFGFNKTLAEWIMPAEGFANDKFNMRDFINDSCKLLKEDKVLKL